MHTTSRVRSSLLVLVLMCFLALVGAGCSSATSKNTTSQRSSASATPSPTATALPSPTVAAYLLPTAPLLPVGWTWYRDSVGHFQIPLAPGWGVGTFYGDWTPQAEGCKYRIQFFPPGAKVTPGQAQATFAARLIEIDVNLSCPPPPWSFTPDQYTVQEQVPIMVDSQPVILWDNDVSGQIFHYALATFRGHQFAFDVQSRPESAIPGDLKVFLQMLHGFQYTG